MKVTLRKKKLANGRSRYYLDFYPAIINPINGKETRREFIKMFIYDRPKTGVERKHNKKIKMIAESVRAKRQLAIIAGEYDFLSNENLDTNFLDFFKELAKEREKTGINTTAWRSGYMYFYRFCKGHVPFKKITKEKIEEYKKYLLNTKQLKRNKRLSQNSASSYFNIFREAVIEAFYRKLLPDNPLYKVKTIPTTESKREFLTPEELQHLAKTPYHEYPPVKIAALFSSLTGLRYGDIEKLTWGEIQHSKSQGYFIYINNGKTGAVQKLDISDQAIELLGERQNFQDTVIPELKYYSVDKHLPRWTIKAGIEKHITFHSFRHTHATLLLANGIDIYTIKKRLNHKNIETTEIYAHLMDKKQKEAANALPKLNIKN